MAATVVSGRAGIVTSASGISLGLILKDSDGTGTAVAPAVGGRLRATLYLPSASTTGTVTAPSGWVQHAIIQRDSVAPVVQEWSKTVTAGDTAGTVYTWSWTGSGTRAAFMQELAGIDNSTPMNGTPTTIDNGGTSVTSLASPIPALASQPVSGGLGVAVVAVNTTAGTFATWTNTYAQAYAGARYSVANKTFAGTTPVTAEADWTNAGQAVGYQVVYRPSTGTALPTLPTPVIDYVPRVAELALDVSGATDVTDITWTQVAGPADISSTIVVVDQPTILTYAYATVPGTYSFQASATGPGGGPVQAVYQYVVSSDGSTTRKVWLTSEGGPV